LYAGLARNVPGQTPAAFGPSTGNGEQTIPTRAVHIPRLRPLTPSPRNGAPHAVRCDRQIANQPTEISSRSLPRKHRQQSAVPALSWKNVNTPLPRITAATRIYVPAAAMLAKLPRVVPAASPFATFLLTTPHTNCAT